MGNYRDLRNKFQDYFGRLFNYIPESPAGGVTLSKANLQSVLYIAFVKGVQASISNPSDTGINTDLEGLGELEAAIEGIIIPQSGQPQQVFGHTASLDNLKRIEQVFQDFGKNLKGPR